MTEFLTVYKYQWLRASFLLVGDLNGHHQEWLGPTTTNRHVVAAFDFVMCLVAISWLSAQPVQALEYYYYS